MAIITNRRCRPALVVLGLALALLAAQFAAAAAAAHPLGNFTINRYSRLAFADGAVRITYVLDLAEIPTFQQMKRLDTDGDGALSPTEAGAYLDAELPVLVDNLQLTVGGRALPLAVLDRAAAFVPGQGGLPTLRVEAHLGAELPRDWSAAGAARYADRNYPDRLGWREVVVQGGDGVAVEGSSAPAVDQSDELRSYPQDLLASPLARSEATFTLAPSGPPQPPRSRGGAREGVAGRVWDNPAINGGAATSRVAALVTVDRLTPTIVLVSILAALFWGAAHALTPGHGKTVVAAYLVGARGTARHAAFLGLTVTVTHTAGVFALGAVTLYLSRYLLPETLYPWLNVISGLLVVAIGLALVYQRGRGLLNGTTGEHRHAHDDGPHDHSHIHAHDGYAHAHGEHDYHHHDHDREHGHSHPAQDHPHRLFRNPQSAIRNRHSHLPPGADGSRVTWRGLLALGVSGGLLPCPSALVLLLGAISLGRLEFGMILVLAFSAGLAVVLTGIGIALVYARRLFERFSFESRLPRALPVASALAISLAGLAILLDALKQAGVV